MTAGFQATMVVVDPDPSWPEAFAEEAERLRGALDGDVVRVERHGSTSVPGWPPSHHGHPGLAGARRRRRAGAPARPASGYAHVPWPGDDDGYPSRQARGQLRTHHVHACRPGSDAEQRHLAMRDYLRATPAEARAYGDMKLALAAACRGDRQCYVDGKDAYVKALRARAIAWAAGRPR